MYPPVRWVHTPPGLRCLAGNEVINYPKKTTNGLFLEKLPKKTRHGTSQSAIKAAISTWHHHCAHCELFTLTCLRPLWSIARVPQYLDTD